MSKKKISDTWKAFLDALIEKANGVSLWSTKPDTPFGMALGVIQDTLKENKIFEIGE